MNKFELSKKIDMVPSLRDKNQRKLLAKVAGQMVQIENSYYLGNIYTTTTRNWSALALLDKENLKPFIGFVDLGIDDDAIVNDGYIVGCVQSMFAIKSEIEPLFDLLKDLESFPEVELHDATDASPEELEELRKMPNLLEEVKVKKA